MKKSLPKYKAFPVWWMVLTFIVGGLFSISHPQAAVLSEELYLGGTETPTATETETPLPSTVTVTSTSTHTSTPSPSNTPTITPTPDCSLIVPGSFVVANNDQLQFEVTNNNIAHTTLTSTTLIWTDYYHPSMLVDYFRFAGVQYWNGDSFDSPTTRTSSVPFPGSSTQSWELDFDGYGNMYNVTHTIGPFSLELTFNTSSDCMVSATIPEVHVEIFKPFDGQIITNQNQTNFEARGWDTGVGTQNGDGIERMHMVVINSAGTVVLSGNRQDTSVPYCMWGSASPCPNMLDNIWNNLSNGTYTMIAWAKSSVTASWSPPAQVTFTLSRTLPTPTATRTSTSTATKTSTPTPTATLCPFPVCTATPTSTVTHTPTATKTATTTNTPTPTATVTLTKTSTQTPTNTATSTSCPPPTITITPTFPPSITPTVEPCLITPTLTSTPTPSLTLTSSMTPSIVPSTTSTPTEEPSLTPSPTPSITPPPTPSVTPTPTEAQGSIQGVVYLQGRTDHSGTIIQVFSDAILLGEVVTNADGGFNIYLYPGTYDLVVERASYLDARQTGIPVEVGTIVSLPPVTLLGGDTNNSDTINILDLAFIGARYGLSEGDPGWSPAADINGDGTVNLLDLTIAASNFGKSSPVAW